MGKYDSWLGVALTSVVAAGTIAAGVLSIMDELQSMKSKTIEAAREATESKKSE